MFTFLFRWILTPAILVAALSTPLLADLLCKAINIAFADSYATCAYSMALMGYQITAETAYTFDCSVAEFSGCRLCLLGLIITDPDHDNSYTGPAGRGRNSTSYFGCDTSNQGLFSMLAFPAMGTGLPANCPYKVRFLATPEPPGGCTDDPDDYTHVITITGTTGP